MSAIPFHLQGMEHALTQQSKSCSSISHAFDQFELVDFSFNEAIVLGKSQSRHYCCLVTLNACDKALSYVAENFEK